MDRGLSAAQAWARLADALAAPLRAGDARVGRIALRPHQREAVAQVRSVLEAHGMALLADATGLGKTYVACAIARDAQAAVVVAPATLRRPWHRAAHETGVSCVFVSHEALSRGDAAAPLAPDLVIIDEAHHARTPTTRRWRALAALCRGARVLALTATPIHNRLDDLAALFALAWGDAAWQASPAMLLRGVVRRDVGDVRATLHGEIPDVAPWIWHPAPDAPTLAAALAAVPPAVPPVDGREAAPLWRLGLVRAWASSIAALQGALRRRLARGMAMAQALDDGRDLTRAELQCWTDEDAVTPMLALESPATPATPTRAPCRATIAAHLDGLRAVARLARDSPGDAARVAHVRATLDADPDARAVLFTTSEATAAMYWRQFRLRPGSALATGRGARIASGPVDRAEVFDALDRHGPAARHAREQVRLLIATDVASEGLTLSAASLVWHADLPWTPARVAQRVGRLARLGSPHRVVTVHAFAPPGSSEMPLQLVPRLVRKASAAALVAPDGAWLPNAPPIRMSHTAAWNALRELAMRQAREAPRASDQPAPTAAAAHCPAAPMLGPQAGIVAVLHTEAGPVCWSFGAAGPPDPSPVAAWALLADARPVPDPSAHAKAVTTARARVRRAVAQQDAWQQVMGGHRADRAADAPLHRGAGRTVARDALLARLGRELRRVPATQRAAATTDAARWRERLARPVAAGWTPALASLAASPAGGAAWWAEAVAVAAQLGSGGGVSRVAVRAIFVLVTEPPTR